MTNEQLEAAAAAHSLNQSHANLTQTFTAESSAVRALIAAYTDATSAAARFAMTNPGMMMPIPGGRRPKKLAIGGIIKGPGTGTSDSIPAMLSNGEAVIPAENVKKYPGMVAGLIAGNIPGFARGGRALTPEDSTFISSIAGGAPARSQIGVTDFLTKELERMPETIVEEFKTLVTTMSQEIRLSGTALEKNLKEFRSRYISTMNQQDEAQFSHIGAGRQITAGNLNQSGALRDTKTQERLDYFIEKVGTDVAVDLKTGFGADFTGFLNNAMQEAGASLEDVIQDSVVGGTEKWRTAIKIGGGKFEEVGEDLERFDARFNQNLQSAYDRGGRIILDSQSQIEELRAKAIAKGETFDDRVYVALDTITNETLQNVGTLRQGLDRVFEEALQTITEIRYNGLTQEQAAALGPEFSGRGRNTTYGRITPGATTSRRRRGGVGDFRNIQEGSFLNTATQDARAYNSQIEANTEDIYVVSRDRTSPHRLAPKDGRDDARAYAEASAREFRKRRRVSRRPQGPAPIGPVAPEGATVLPIVSQPTQSDLRRTRRRDQIQSAKARVAKNFGGGRGMAASSALMMGSQFLPGKAGNIASQVSGIAFVAQSLMMLPGPLKLFAAGLIASVAVYKIFSSAIEKARLKIEGLGDVATMSKEKLSTLGSFFGVTARGLSRETRKPGTVAAPIGATQRSAVDQLKATEDFQKNFKNDINALRSATVEDATMIFNALAIQLKGRGFASEQIKTIIQALQEEAGKTNISLDFANIGVATAESVAQQATVIGLKIQKVVDEAVARTVQTSGGGRRQDPFSDEQEAAIDAASSAMSAVLDGLIGQFEGGEISAESFKSSIDAMSQSILKMPQATQAQLIAGMLEKLGRDAQVAVSGINDYNTKLKTTIALSMGLISADNPIFKVLKKATDPRILREFNRDLDNATNNYFKKFQENTDADALGDGIEGATGATEGLSKASEAYLKILDKEITALEKKRDANKSANNEMQRQIDLQLKMQDLSNQMKIAQISGNYLGASLLGQQQRKTTLEFNQETKAIEEQKVIDRMKEREAAIEGGAKLTPAEKAKLNKNKVSAKVPKFHNWNGPVPGTYGQELPAMLRSGTEGVYQEGYINDLKQAASSTMNSASSVYNVTMTINGGNSSPAEIADQVMKRMQVISNKNNKSNAGLM